MLRIMTATRVRIASVGFQCLPFARGEFMSAGSDGMTVDVGWEIGESVAVAVAVAILVAANDVRAEAMRDGDGMMSIRNKGAESIDGSMRVWTT